MTGSPRLLVLACGALAREVLALVRLNGWTHVDVRCLPARLHLVPDEIPAAVDARLAEVEGRYDAAKLKAAAARVRGVDAKTVRTAREPAAMSFALDPKQQSARAAVLAVQAGLPKGIRVELVRAVAAGH